MCAINVRKEWSVVGMKASDPALSVYFLQLDGNSGTEKEMGEVVERGQEEEGKNGDANRPDQPRAGRTENRAIHIHCRQNQ